MASDNLDKVLRLLDYETLQMLVLFKQHQTFTGVTDTLGFSEKTVRVRLQELDAKIQTQGRTPILHQRNGRRWALTPAGERFADTAGRIATSMRSAVYAIEGGHRIDILTTSNCCDKLSTVKRWFSDPTGATIHPTLKQSSGVTADALAKVDFAFHSTLIEIDESSQVAVGGVTPLDGGEMLVLDIDPIHLLICDPPSGGVRHGSARDLLDEGYVFCVPEGGVPWDYMQRVLPDWQDVLFQQCFRIDDLNQGLHVLAAGLAGPRAAMLVHGMTSIDPRLSQLGFNTLVRVDDRVRGPGEGSPQLRAATGLVRTTRSSYSEASQQVWAEAQARWTELTDDADSAQPYVATTGSAR